MKGKWATGITPRNFVWVIKDHLAASERPGGYARNHRRIRRQEEIIWIRNMGFSRVISLLPSPHNLHAYDELDVKWEHVPFPPHADARSILADLYPRVRQWLAEGEKLLIHQEEFGDVLSGGGQCRIAGDHGALQFEETNLGRVLITDVVSQKGIVGYREEEVVRSTVDLGHAQGVLA